MIIIKTKIQGKQNKKIVIMLSGWKTRQWMFWPFSKILALNGFQCITYTYDDKILTTNIRNTVAYTTYVANSVLKKIIRFKKEGYKDFSLFGTSLGTIMAVLAASQTRDVSRVILNTTGADIAEVIWKSKISMPEFKTNVIKRMITLKTLKKVLHPISPIYRLNGLKGKKILVYLSAKDEIFSLSQGNALINGLKSKKIPHRVFVDRTSGHFITATKNLLRAEQYIRFLHST